MKYEYLIFNLVVISGPLAMSFHRNLNFYKKWRFAFAAIVLVMIPFIIWDSLVANSHWWFNEAYTLSLRIAGLPIEEWLFFITVPFACLLTWESIQYFSKNQTHNKLRIVPILLLLGIPFGAILFETGKQYTGLVLISIGITAFLDFFLNTNIFRQRNTYIFLTILSGLILIFNGYLTARPVVLYDPQYQLDFRILTIPVEDFGYGSSLMLLCVILYEKFMGRLTNQNVHNQN